MNSVQRPLKMRVLCVVAAIVFLFSFQLSTVYAYPGLLYGGAIQLGVQLMYDMFMIGINSAGGTDQIRTSFRNQSLQPTMKDYISYLADGWWDYWTEHSDPEDVIGWDAFLNEFGGDMRYKSDGTVIVGNRTADYIHSFLEWCQDNGYIDVVTSSETTYPTQTGTLLISSLGDGQALLDYAIANNAWPMTLSSSVRSAVSSFFSSYGNHPISIEITYSSTSPMQSSGWIVISSFTGYGIGNSIRTGGTYNAQILSLGSGGRYTYPETISLTSTSSTLSGSTFHENGYATSSWLVTKGYNNVNAVAVPGAAGYDVWNQDDDDDGYVIAPQGALDGLSGVQDGSMANVGDLLDTVADVIAGTDSAALPIAGTAPVAVSLPTDYALPVDVAVPADVVGAVPVEGAATEPYTNTGEYTLSLADFFPFCIPFDVYRMLSALDAEPVAPVVSLPFPIPGSTAQNVTIDLSPFDSVAQVLRSLETLAFAVGLGLGTKKLLFGS